MRLISLTMNNVEVPIANVERLIRGGGAGFRCNGVPMRLDNLGFDVFQFERRDILECGPHRFAVVSDEDFGGPPMSLMGVEEFEAGMTDHTNPTVHAARDDHPPHPEPPGA